MDRRTAGVLGTTASILAGLLIVIVLYTIYAKSVGQVFKVPGIIYLVLLVASGIPALIGYSEYAEKAKWHMKTLSPIALSLGAVSILVGYLYDALIGGFIIVVAYIIELQVGARLYQDFETTTRLGAILFLVGVLVFMLFLPLILVIRTAALASMAGDLVKVMGLIVVLYRFVYG